MTDEGADATGSDREDVEVIAEALASRRRRFVLYFLSEHGSASVSELADVVAGWTAVAEARIATPTDREMARGALVDRDLPAMAAIGLIEYDSETESASLVEGVGEQRPFASNRDRE